MLSHNVVFSRNKIAMQSSPVDQLLSRVSNPRLSEPSPSPEILDEVFRCALRAPDHMRLRPWRYLLVEGAHREFLGNLFETASIEASMQRDETLSETQREKLRKMPLRAPLIIIAISKNLPHAKVPMHEQELSVGAGLSYMLLALQSNGFGGIWRTGDMAENAHVKAGLGVQAQERIVGFLYVGTPLGDPKKIEPLDPADFFKVWQP